MLASFFLLPLHNGAFMQLFPIFLSTPPAEDSESSIFLFSGGLGLSAATVGLYLSAYGIFGILLQLLIYPSLQARIGTLRAYRLALCMFPFAYILAPYLSFLSSHSVGRWFCIAGILFTQVTARTFGIPSSVILLTNAAPAPGALSRIHGAGNMVQSLARAGGPAVAGWAYGWGLENGCIGAVWWGWLTVIAALGLWESWKLQENGGRGKGVAKRW